MNKNVEVVSLVYKSIKYLHFICEQLKSDLCKVDGWDVGVRIVANDATPEVIEELKKLDINYSIFNNPNPNEFYLNRVYRAYNYAVTSSEYDNVCLVNSDDVFCREWLSNLLKHHDGINIPCSRLIESGKMDSGTHGVNLMKVEGKHFGRHPDEFDKEKWLSYAETIKEDRVKNGGLYMPCVVEKKRFIESGKFPEGNMFINRSVEDGKIKNRVVCGYPNDRPVWKAGDDFYFHHILEPKYGMKHITVFDSPVYHIIEGEKDE
jgi:hypothetical protein